MSLPRSASWSRAWRCRRRSGSGIHAWGSPAGYEAHSQTSIKSYRPAGLVSATSIGHWGLPLEHDPEKREPVFGKDRALTISGSGMTIQRKVIPLRGTAPLLTPLVTKGQTPTYGRSIVSKLRGASAN